MIVNAAAKVADEHPAEYSMSNVVVPPAAILEDGCFVIVIPAPDTDTIGFPVRFSAASPVFEIVTDASITSPPT